MALRLRDRQVFMWQSQKILNVFNTLRPIFSKTKTFFQKTGVPFLVESTKIENTTFPYKTSLSEVNVKTNKMGSTRWICYKERSFASNYFIFSEILFQFKSLVSCVDLMYQPPKYLYSYFPKVLEFYLWVLFPCEYP